MSIAPRPTLLGYMRLIQPVVMVLLMLLIFATGVKTLARGKLIYYNYRLLPVFAPFTLVIGGLGLVWVYHWWKKWR